MIAVVVAAIAVVGYQVISWRSDKAAEQAAREAQAARAQAPAPPPVGQTERAEPAWDTSGEDVFAGAGADEGAPPPKASVVGSAQMWLAAYADAERDSTRSPFQRKYEGLGKIFIRSRPSGANVYINGIKMPRQTDWLVPVSFPAGTYVLELRKEGYDPYVTDLVVPKGMADFEQIATINAALRKKEAIGIQQAHRKLLYIEGQPKVRVSMIMYGDPESWAVIQDWPPGALADPRKWVVTEGDEIQIQKAVPGKQLLEERIKIISIHPESVTIRNMLMNLDYNFPIGTTWTLPETGPTS